MHVWHVADIVAATHGTLLRGDAQRRVQGVSTDSRSVGVGEVFVALQGERFDGHRFVAAALRQGAAAVLVSQMPTLPTSAAGADEDTGAVILVPDTLAALQALAQAHRQRFSGSVVAITGSNGKTTVKEMTAAVLQTRFATYKASGNLNNHIGLPLTFLRMDLTHEVAVVEMGMNHLGEIRRLCEIVRPHIGVLTNIALAHVGYLGSLARIQQAKGELIDALFDLQPCLGAL